MANIMRLGGGANGNELIVTAPTGSNVTATKDGKTRTALENNGTWTFKGLGAGTWVITATNGSSTASKTVTFVDEQSAELSYYEDNFADNDWATIIGACQSGSAPDTWVVGDSKPMTINGTSYTIDIIDKDHDTYTAGGTAPLTFQLHELYATRYQMNSSDTNSGGYGGSAMHTTHLPAIKALMPSEVRAAIKPVNKLTSAGNKSTDIEVVSCDLFLLSEIEKFGTVVRSIAGEGSQYAYYSAGNGDFKYQPGSSTEMEWWERSPSKVGNTTFCCVGADGDCAHDSASQSFGVSFCFCF